MKMKHLKIFENFDSVNEQVYYDMNKKPLKLGDLVEVQVVTGKYGQTATYQGKITKMPDQFGNIELDNEYTVNSPFENGVGYYKHNDYEHGHERYVKKIDPSERDAKYDVPKRFRPTYTIRLVDYTGGKNADKNYASDFPVITKIIGTEEFEAWLEENYPTAVKQDNKIRAELVKKYDDDWYKQFKNLNVHQSSPHASGYLMDYLIDYK